MPNKETMMGDLTRWMLEGMEKGWMRGREIGRQEGASDILLRLLRRSAGQLTDRQEKRIRRLKLELFEELAEDLLDFSGPKDLKAWLKAHK
jgi:Domain of unknown function (DUF4351)